MKFAKWTLIFPLLICNQLVRSPFHLWNWGSEQLLAAEDFKSVVYESNKATLEILERKTTDDSTQSLLVVIPDMRSPVGFWKPFLEEVAFDGTIRFVKWFGNGDSHWAESTIVFADLDNILKMTLSDLDEDVSVHLVGQGIGAQLAIRWVESNPSFKAKVYAIHSEGFNIPRLMPQSISELKEMTQADLKGEWLPKFVFHDWLTWFNNPFVHAIEKETHLVPKFKNAQIESLADKIVWVGFAPEGNDVGLESCSFEMQWTCKTDLLDLLGTSLK